MPKKKFRVWYTTTSYRYLDVEADNYVDAQLKAQGVDGVDFKRGMKERHDWSWDFDKVEEIKG